MSAERALKGWYGELRIVKRVGTMIYKWAGQDVAVSAYGCRCKKGHREVRSAASLRLTGEGTKCKQCRSAKRLRLTDPPKRRAKGRVTK